MQNQGSGKQKTYPTSGNVVKKKRKIMCFEHKWLKKYEF